MHGFSGVSCWLVHGLSRCTVPRPRNLPTRCSRKAEATCRTLLSFELCVVVRSVLREECFFSAFKWRPPGRTTPPAQQRRFGTRFLATASDRARSLPDNCVVDFVYIRDTTMRVCLSGYMSPWDTTHCLDASVASGPPGAGAA